mgnify:CR=1 FL=1
MNNADYYISKISLNDFTGNIERVALHENNGSRNPGPETIRAREFIVDLIKRGNEVWTILKDNSGFWVLGEKVIIIKVNHIDYIKTEPNETEGDNLENLPEF